MKKIYSKPFAELMLIEEDSLLAGVSRPIIKGTDDQYTSDMGSGGSGGGAGAYSKKNGFSIWESTEDEE